MAIASLAWNLKARYGLLIPYLPLGKAIVRMEFKRFVNTFINIPCLIIKTIQKYCFPDFYSCLFLVSLTIAELTGRRQNN